MHRVIAILEDDPARIEAMRASLREFLPGVEQRFFEHAGEMIAWLADHLSDVMLISLDHDLPIRRGDDGEMIDFGTGRQVVDYLCTVPVSCPVIVHSSNNVFAPGMVRCLKDAGWTYARVYPYIDTDWVRTTWTDQIKAYLRDGLISA
jgi:hypothetical protein